MKRFLFLIVLFAGVFSGMSQSYVLFQGKPRMQLQPRDTYNHCQVKYRTSERSTIYLELKKGNQIVASGMYEVPARSEDIIRIPLTTKRLDLLTPGANYSYNLYMYAGAPNDWTKKACRSAHIPRVQMGKSTGQKETKVMSLRNFFK